MPEPESDQQADTTPPSDGAKTGKGKTAQPSDEMKKKFRELLEKKNHQSADSKTEQSTTGSKIHNAHGPTDQKRTFRRKSG